MSLLKLHLYFELLFLPKMWEILTVRHMTHPQHSIIIYYTCQVFNRITECNCIWRIPRWLIEVKDFLIEIHFFSYEDWVNWVEAQLTLLCVMGEGRGGSVGGGGKFTPHPPVGFFLITLFSLKLRALNFLTLSSIL